MLAIGEGLLKNTRLQHLSLRGSQIHYKHLTEFINSCRENKRLGLRSIDLSSNSLCDLAGVQLAKCFKGLKHLETLNLKNNCFEQEAGDAFLYLVKENPQISKCNLEMNMVKFHQAAEIDKTCKLNKQIIAHINVPQIKKEIKGLKRLKHREALTLNDINAQMEKGKQTLQNNLNVIRNTESVIERIREESRVEKEEAES